MGELNLEVLTSAESKIGEFSIPNPEDRGTEELVIALVGPIGSGVSECARIIETQLVDGFGYEKGGLKKISSIIERYSSKVDISIDKDDQYKRTSSLQEAGTSIRSRFGPTAVIDLATAEISQGRPDRQGAVDGQGRALPAQSRRVVTIIDAVKTPAEVKRLRAVYKSAFWLVGVFAPENKRQKRMKDRFRKPEDLAKAMRVDEDDESSFGQKVAKTMEMADYFIRNDSDSTSELSKSVERFLKILFDVGVNTPTRDESSMYAAAAAASRSACLSRQVGVVIVNQDGEIIGTGTNDVPKYGGGLYPGSDKNGGSHDHRCYNWQNGICHNDDRKRRLVDHATDDLVKFLAAGKKEDARKAVAASEVKSLIEFSRAVHAEMEAIVSVARTGGRGIVGSSLYSTTFPCHNCARHIVAAGIERVYYIEPYAKSLALDLHDDAISTDVKDAGSKVVFVQYEGVSPNSYLALFKSGLARKREGIAIATEPRTATPVIKEPLDDFARREDIAVVGVKDLVSIDVHSQKS